MDDLLNEFLTETAESISVIDAELVKFEQEPNNAEILKNIFRLVHTIKGTSGFLGLPRLESVAHAGEDVLGKFRDGDLEVTPEAVTLILKAIDAIKDLLAGVEEAGSELAGDDSALIAELQALAAGDGGSPAAAPAVPAGEGIEAPVTEADGFPVAKELLDEVAAAAAEAPVTEADGFPVAKELLDEVEGATAAGKRAATDDELAAELVTENDAKAAPAAAAGQVPAVRKSDDVAAEKRGADAQGIIGGGTVDPCQRRASGESYDAGERACADSQPVASDGCAATMTASFMFRFSV